MTEYELTLVDYLAIMRRRARPLIGIFALVFLIAVALALATPPTFRASGTIMVESPREAEGMLHNGNRSDPDERINIIQQRVMTREGLLPIINKYNLFKGGVSSLTTADLIDKMQSRVTVEPISSKSGQDKQTIAFTISFEDRHPDVALQVTNDLIALFMHLNVSLRTKEATETVAFLNQESNKLKAEVDRLEDKISAYKKQNSDNLPEQMNLREAMTARAENDLYAVERDIRSGNEDLRSLEAELAAANHGIGDDSTQTLPALKAQYAKLSAIYTDAHPDIIELKRKIDALQGAGSALASKNVSADATNLVAFKIQAKINAVNARLDSLTQQKKMLQRKIAQNENAMENTPLVGQGLDMLVRDRDSAQKKFDEIRNKLMNAQIAQNLESENRAERFTLLEPPILPEKPFKPHRIKILALGLLLALASSAGAAMFMESIDKRIHGAEALTHVLGYRPLAVIPYIATIDDAVLQKQMVRLALKRALIAAAIILISVMAPLAFLAGR